MNVEGFHFSAAILRNLSLMVEFPQCSKKYSATYFDYMASFV